MTIEIEPLSKVAVARKSAWKSGVDTLILALSSLGIVILMAAGDWLMDAQMLGSFLGGKDPLVVAAVLALASFGGKFLKDYAKHAK